jgi:hypothetical protein
LPSLVCPRCGQRLTVSEFAPRTLVCPRCLGVVLNPAGLTPAEFAMRPPVRVLPLDYEVRRDSRTSSVMLFLMAAVLGIGAWLTFQGSGVSQVSLALLAACVGVLVTAILQRVYPESEGVQAAGRVFNVLAKAFFIIALILIGLLLLLFGLCFVAMR